MNLNERYACRAINATGTKRRMKRGQVTVGNIRVTEETYAQIKALALLTGRTISGQVRELLQTSLEPR